MLRFSRPVTQIAKGTASRAIPRSYTTAIPKKMMIDRSKIFLTAAASIGFTGGYMAFKDPAFSEAPAYAGTIEDPATKLSFPIFLNTSNEWKKLIGLGVRTVTFLSFYVYVLGMYMRNEDIESLKSLPGWKDFDKEKFLENEEMANQLLDQPFDISIRIIPFRNTNTQHLRDGFVRSFLQRMKDQSLTEDEEREILVAIQEFKSNFATMNVKKETEFVFTKTREGGLKIVYEGKDWGTVNNKWLSKNFVMSYLTPNSPSSEAAHEDIVLGFERLMKVE